MIVKVPEQIRVGSFIYDLLMVEKLTEDFKLLGQSLTDQQIIKIDSHIISNCFIINFL